MPQYLEIQVAGHSEATLKTSHRQGTRYDVYWSTTSGFHREFFNVNTEIECQPDDQTQRRRDFRNDFAHMRRAIAAASVTGKRFLDALDEADRNAPSELDAVKIRLRTNRYDRGVIAIDPTGGGEANLEIEVGSGPTRPPNAHPTQVKKYVRENIDISGACNPLSAAIRVLDSEARWMLELLSRYA